MKPKKRFNSAAELKNAIEAEKRKALLAFAESEELDKKANKLRDEGDRAYCDDLRFQSSAKRKAGVRHEEKAKQFGNLLAEFCTQPMPFLGDDVSVAQPSRKRKRMAL